MHSLQRVTASCVQMAQFSILASQETGAMLVSFPTNWLKNCYPVTFPDEISTLPTFERIWSLSHLLSKNMPSYLNWFNLGIEENPGTSR